MDNYFLKRRLEKYLLLFLLLTGITTFAYLLSKVVVYLYGSISF